MSAPEADPRLTFALALLAGMFAQALARHLRLPAIVLLLLGGVALGPDGLGWIDPRQLGLGLFWIVDFAVAVILFEGGLNLELSRLRRSGEAIRRMASVKLGRLGLASNGSEPRRCSIRILCCSSLRTTKIASSLAT